MTKEELQSVLKIQPEYIHAGRDVGLEGFDFFVDCKSYGELVAIDNFEKLDNLKCSVRFDNCKFSNTISGQNKTYQHAFLFQNCEFQKVELTQCCFEKEMGFYDCAFGGGITFGGSIIKENITFNACRFRQAVFVRTKFIEASSFVRSIFENNAIFYGAEFNKLVNFNQATFEGGLSLVNAKLKVEHSELKSKIDGNANTANDYRDSFRAIKSTLLKTHNTLDASQYHKMELYCKEIELEFKEQKSLSDWLEKWQLWFYRKTSDHHTDLLKIIAWVLVWVGFCGLALFAYRYGGRLLLQPKSGSLLGVFQKSYGWFYGFLSTHHVGYVALFLLLGFLLASLLLRFVGRGLLCARYCKYLSFVLGAVYSLCVAIQNPKYILGIANFTTLADSDWVENIILLFYTIGMILLLFSLQKTARKNTIIPS